MSYCNQDEGFWLQAARDFTPAQLQRNETAIYNRLIMIAFFYHFHRGIGGEFSWEYAVVVSGFFRVHSLATSVLVGVIGGRVSG